MPRNDLIARCSVVVLLGLGILATSGEVLHGIQRWGGYDWDYFFFQGFSIYRSITEFGELPLWNPWYMGGVPSIGNFQSHFPSPWVLLDLLLGPVVAIKLNIVAHQVIGVAAMYWMARGFGMSRLAATYVSGTFFFSAWVALRIHSGHLTYLSTAYLPLLVGLFARDRGGPRVVSPIVSAALVTLMIFEGGIYDVIFAGFILAPMTMIWCFQDRSARPLLYAAVVAAWAMGFSAVKVLPVADYMMENPRTTKAGNVKWKRIAENPHASDLDEAVPGRASDQEPVDSSPAPRPFNARKDGPIPKSEFLRFFVHVFLGRDQRSNQYYSPLQTYGWHEYGVYIGPLAVVLALAAPFLAFRQTWPWLVVALFCFLTAAGNFAPFAPWTLLHKLPVCKSMHCPSRLLTPCVFAALIASGFALDALRKRLAGYLPNWFDFVIGFLVVLALVDSVLVARHSIEGTFPYDPPISVPGTPDLVTIEGDSTRMTALMLENKSTATGYEPIQPKVWVQITDSKDYHGEAYIRPDLEGEPIGKVDLVRWTPNTVEIQANCATAGTIVVNRNWYGGWRTDPPFTASSFEGLISTHVGPGQHTVRFVFAPSDFRVGLCISLLTLAAAAAFVFRQTGRRFWTRSP